MTASTIGIDLGGTKLAAVRVRDGVVEDGVELPTPQDPERFAAAPIEAARRLLAEGVAGVGMGVAGLVRWPEGRLVWGPNVVGREIAFRAALEDALGLPALVDNDANVAVLAEGRLGAARGFEHVVMVTVGTGIGGGLLVGGSIYRGRSFAGEVGHMTVDPDGPACNCGRSGCWEQLASGTALDRMAARAVEEDAQGAIARLASGAPSGSHVAEAARAGDAKARMVLEELGGWLGLGVANLIAAMDPEVVVIGGGVARLGELLLEPARRAAGEALSGRAYREPTPIMGAALGEEAGALGAALLAEEAVRWAR